MEDDGEIVKISPGISEEIIRTIRILTAVKIDVIFV